MKPVKYLFLLFSLSAMQVYAQTCQELLAQLPDHSKENSAYTAQINNFKEGCKNRQNSDDPAVMQQCMAAGLNSMIIYGNYIAAEMVAKMHCEAGNVALSKNVIASILYNENAPQGDKDIAAKMQEITP